ncbi:amino acid adenylation domain-containing protein (plasmid) [Embleya sp. NBC_00888]|uniref:amino acid adenylation domain-containing protein n=1 Tax=Embleya sp. NBC_00888 TaxID=2975960 RepID=UPI002F90BD3C|nr:amino acid adenylation domain-containing protein [Embleya sp. NBC_00888]
MSDLNPSNDHPAHTPAALWSREAFENAPPTVRAMVAPRELAPEAAHTRAVAVLARHRDLSSGGPTAWCGTFTVDTDARRSTARVARVDATPATAWVDRGPDLPGLLVLALPGAVVDGTSWRILADELRSGLRGEPIAPEPAPTADYAGAVAHEADDPQLVDRATAWFTLIDRVDDLDAPAPWPGSEPGAWDTPPTGAATMLELPFDTGPLSPRTPLRTIVASTAARILGPFAPGPLFVDVVEDDRDRHDGRFAHTVGDLRRVFPALLEPGSPDTDALPATPRAAADFGLALYLGEQTAGALADAPEAGVLLAYGHTDLGDEELLAYDRESDGYAASRYPLRLDLWVDHSPAGAGRRVALRVVADPKALPELDVAALLRSWRAALEPALLDAARAGPEDDAQAGDLAARDAALDSAIGGLGVAEVLPLSPLQEGLLFHLMLDGAARDIYVQQAVLFLDGPVDADRLADAARQVLEKYPNLRAGFVSTEDGPVQVIPERFTVPFAYADLTDGGADVDAAFEAFADRQREIPFDAARPPLIRFALARTSDTGHRLLLTSQVALLDGWSGGLALTSLLEFYTDAEAESTRATTPFRVFLRWLGTRDRDAARDAWYAYLGDVAEPTLLAGPRRPGDDATPASAGEIHREVPAALAARLAARAREAGVTVGTLYESAWGLLLGRLTGRDDTVFGALVSGRHPDVDGIDTTVGVLFNTVPVRVRVAPHEPIAQLWRRTQDDKADLHDHPYLGLSELQAMVGAGPLFDTFFVFQNLPLPDKNREFGPEGGLRVLGHAVRDATHYPVSVVITPGEVTRLRAMYHDDAFDRADVELLTERYLRILEAFASDPTRACARVDILEAAERRRVVDAWNATSHPVPEVTVADLLEERAGLVPDAVAVVQDPDGAAPLVWSYRELNERSNRIARLLRARGAGPERVVGLALPRTADMVAALFAVLKTGAAYLPIERDVPAERTAWMLADTAPVCVLTSGPGPDTPDAVDLDDASVRAELAGLSGADLSDAERSDFVRSEGSRLEHPAYVIYTSGSTGRPKGVVTPYRGLTNMQVNHRREIFDPVVAAAGRRLRVAHTVSFAFDMSWEELLWLVEGHEVHVCDEELRRDAHALTRYVDRHRIDVVNVTPTYAQHLLEEGLLESDATAGRHRPALVLLGGEAVSDGVWAALRDTEGVLGYNLYGPTEYTINTLGAGTEDSTTPAIGRPILNTATHILDANLQPVPVGVPGELYVTGIGLARGYLNAAGQTAARFVANPYGPPGSRLYRTGDLARRRPDGIIDYLGRTDDQIKIRGHRIEPAEIQSVLDTHPQVARSAIVPTTGPDGAVQLTAYVVPETAGPVDAHTNDEHIAQWRQIYADEYTAIDTAVFTEDFAGWDSSYDGAPIPLAHMREWRAETIRRITELRPSRVLEIGVGTGLLLGELAPASQSYWATDFAAPVIEKLRADLCRDPELAAKVELRTAPAHELGDLPAAFFDTVVINSVAQYFPSLDYLTDVLRRALDLVRPGGAVFVGDVRNLRLARTFHSAIRLGQATPDTDDASVRAAIERAVLLEKELLVHPDYFAALTELLPDLAGVDLRIKRGHLHNELSRHRYDAVLRRVGGDPATTLADISSVPWNAAEGTDAVARRLTDDRPDALRVRAVPNARLAGEIAAERVLANGGTGTEARDARTAAEQADDAAVEPETLYALGADLGYTVAATWSSAGSGAFDAVFVAGERAANTVVGTYVPTGSGRADLSGYANHPAAAREAGTLVPRLRAFLRERLPEYMVPAGFVPLDRLPLTVNGKLDRRALPAPDAGVGRAPTRAPAGAAELALCALFAEVLGVADIGAEDNFFDLGGHSLLAARLAAKARGTLGVEIAIRDVFTAPTTAALAALLAERAGTDHAGARSLRPAVTRQERPDRVPLSFAQRRLWLLGQFETASAAYHEPIAVRLRGTLDRAALRAAVQDVTNRHETLRTLCVAAQEPAGSGAAEVFQHILAPEDAHAVVEFVDTDTLGAIDAEPALAALVAEATRRPFDLATELPLRTTVFRVGPDEHVFLAVFHHIAIDEWSIRPFAQDLAAAYTARAAGHAPAWEPLPLQYADYTLWQRDLLGDPADPTGRYAHQLAYWRTALAALPQELEVPADRPRPTVAGYRGGTVERLIPAELAERVRAVASAAGASAFMFYQAAVAALLHRLGAGTDIPLGSPVAGRDDEALGDLIGFFVNTVVIRADVTGNPTFADLLARVRDTDLDAFAHQDLPFERLVEELNPARSLGRNPLFQVMVGYQNQGVGEVRFGDIAPVGERFTPPTAKFDLDFVFRETDLAVVPEGAVELGIEYAADLFDHSTVEDFAERLLRLLAGITDDPNRRVGAYELLSPAEATRIVDEWNATSHPVPEVTVADLLEERAGLVPDAVAVVQDPDGAVPLVWSYRELNERSNRIARLLRARGAGPERVVGLALPRTADMVAALFAVLKTGAAYLPLERDLPRERIAWMVDEARPVCVLTAGEIVGENTVDLDDPSVRAELAGLSGADLSDAERSDFVRSDGSRLEHPAYVIYTSGSTGRPKGVVTPYRGLTNMQVNHRREIFDPVVAAAGRRLRVAHTVSFAFDMSWEELLWLVEGHEVHVCDEELRRDAHALTRYVDRHRIDVVNVTPTYAQHLLDLGLLDDDPARGGHRPCLVLLGGEAVSDAVWNRLRDTEGVLGYNLYGPTEYTINTLGAGTEDSTTPAIGRPILNTATHILDANLQPVPVGVPGELYVTGIGLARGYLDSPGPTAARFVANPFGPPGSRLYRTGDLARRRPDGIIDYLGRTDDQVKIRGHRIEPAEIQSVLDTHPDVLRSAVVPSADGTRLTAYVVGEADPQTLRAWSAARLPDYMVPGAFVPLDVLPLTVNGKLDRAALPEPDFAAAVTARGPRDTVEAVLCRVFADTLALPRVGIDDNFFTLGGHSLLAVRLVGAIRAAGIVADPDTVTVALVLTAPTVADLAERLRGGTGTDELTAPLLALRPDGDLAPLFCIHAGFGFAWPYTTLLAHVANDRPVYGLQAPMLSGAAAPTRFEDVVAEQLRAVRTLQPQGPYHLLGWSFGGELAFALAAELQRAGERVDLLVLVDAEPPVPRAHADGAGADGGFDEEAARAHLLRATPAEVDLAGALGEEVVAALLRTRVAYELLVPADPYPAFRGDVLCVAARENRTRTGRGAWTAHVLGVVDEYVVDHEHDDLLTSAAVDQWGPLVRRRSDATHSERH